MITRVDITSPRVALITMPWDTYYSPNIALGIIKAQLTEAGIISKVHHPNIKLAGELGYELYNNIAYPRVWSFLGDWIFSKSAFSPDSISEGPQSAEAWFSKANGLHVLEEILGNNYAERLAELREEVAPEFCERLAECLASYSVIGFTCCFNQLVPSLAVARAIKKYNAEARILFGGPQVEGDMGKETLRAFSWVDVVYEGEFEVAGVETVRWCLGQSDKPPVEYASYRDQDGSIKLSTEKAHLEEMDRSPIPDYEEYYSLAKKARDKTGKKLLVGPLPFESSRGCWWGQRSHCTFCALNGQGLSYRSKSPDRVLEEVMEQANRYQQVVFCAADSIIDRAYLRTLLPRLKDLDLGVEFFYETKANLKREEIQLYQAAGLLNIQPGIESFSTPVLKLMRKGISAIRNVYLLKLCRQYGVLPGYNILLGFPGETAEDHIHQVNWIKRLHHFIPPYGLGNFTLQRHSPMHSEWQQFGIKDVKPVEDYDHIFSTEDVEISRLAFYFTYDLQTDPELDRAHRKLKWAVRQWQNRWGKGVKEPELTYRKAGRFLVIIDARKASVLPEKYVIDGLAMEVLLACDDPIGLKKLQKQFIDVEELERVIKQFDELGLVIREGDVVLSLVIPHPKMPRLPYSPKYYQQSSKKAASQNRVAVATRVSETAVTQT